MENQQFQMEKPIKFFTAFFCPFAQMIQISFNEVGQSVLNKIEKIQGLQVDENGQSIVHPELAALDRKQVPTLYYKNEVLKESKDLIRFIDKEFAEKQYTLIPEEEKLRNYSFFIEDYIRDKFISAFYGIINSFENEALEKVKSNILQYIFNIIQGYKGPYYLGEIFSSVDITIAPYFLRMHVLEKIKGFTVPQTEDYRKWFEWKQNLVKRKCIADSIEDEIKVLEVYERYYKGMVKKQQENVS